MTVELWGLFASALIAATLLPGGSELLLLYLVNTGEYPLWQPLLVATVGNTLGGLITFGMGVWLATRWPLARLKKRQQQALLWLRRYGSPALLLAWVPLIGDPLCLVAGWLRIAWLPALLMILLGKLLRYAVVVGVFQVGSLQLW